MLSLLPKEKPSPLRHKPLNVPAQSLVDQRDELFDDQFMLPFMAAGLTIALAAIESWLWFWKIPRNPLLMILFAVGTTLWSAWRMRRAWPKLMAYKLGIQGERTVGLELEKLRVDGWEVLHDIPGDRCNLDHVLISTRGIWVIETKTRTKPEKGDQKVRFDGEQLLVGGYDCSSEYLSQAEAEARWLRRTLKEVTDRDFPVRTILVFPGWFVIDSREGERSGVWVLNPDQVKYQLAKQPQFLLKSDVALIRTRLQDHVRLKKS